MEAVVSRHVCRWLYNRNGGLFLLCLHSRLLRSAGIFSSNRSVSASRVARLVCLRFAVPRMFSGICGRLCVALRKGTQFALKKRKKKKKNAGCLHRRFWPVTAQRCFGRVELSLSPSQWLPLRLRPSCGTRVRVSIFNRTLLRASARVWSANRENIEGTCVPSSPASKGGSCVKGP